MIAFLTSLAIVVLAEMGDKTQLLAMAFATRFRWQTVLWGVFAATVADHLLAVLAGEYITHVLPLWVIKISSAAPVFLFCHLTPQGGEPYHKNKRFLFGPFLCVAAAFFLLGM